MSQTDRPRSSSTSTLTSSPSEHTCGSCSQVVKESSNSIECGLCQIWYHVVCTNLTKSDLKTLSKPSVYWYCEKCTNPLVDINQKIKAIELHLSKLLQNNDENPLIKASTSYAQVAAKLDSNTVFLEKQIKSFKEEVEMERDKEFRSKNLVLFNVPEKPNETENDLKSTINTILNECSIQPLNCETSIKRLGAKKGEKHRPVKIFLSSETQKWDYIKRINSKKHQDIFARRDLNKEEQEQDFRLRQELKKTRDSDPHNSYVIRRGKIVKATK